MPGARRDAAPQEQRLAGDAPARGQLVRERLGRMAGASELSHPVGRDIGDDVYSRLLELGAVRARLPGVRAWRSPRSFQARTNGHGGAGVAVRRRRRREREPTARALAAALDRPGGRCAATRAPWRPDRPQSARGRTHRAPEAGPRQATQRGGNKRSTNHADHATAASSHVSVTAPPQNVRLSRGRASRSRAAAGRPRRAGGCRPRAAARGSRCRTRSTSKRPAVDGLALAGARRRTDRAGRQALPLVEVAPGSAATWSRWKR